MCQYDEDDYELFDNEEYDTEVCCIEDATIEDFEMDQNTLSKLVLDDVLYNLLYIQHHLPDCSQDSIDIAIKAIELTIRRLDSDALEDISK